MRRSLIYLLFFFSGASGLIYEVTWMRALRLVLGSSVEAASTILAVFLAGLGVGSLLGARFSHSGNPLRRYAVAEVVIAATALAVPLWLEAYRALYPTLYTWAAESPTLLAVIRVIMAALAMSPPAIAMGTTLPLLTRAMVTDINRFAWGTGLLYALNTFGAMAGAFAAGFYLPIWLGMNGSIGLAATINILVGVVAWVLSRQTSGEISILLPGATGEVASSLALRPRLSVALLLLAGLSGFGSLAFEVVYFRMLSYHTEGSVYSFSLMLVFVLAFLASAAVWVARNLDRQDAWRFLARTQLTAVAVLLITPLVYLGLPYFAGYDVNDTFGERILRYAITSTAILGPSMLLIGVVLPCTWKIAAADQAHSGRVVGILTGVNTLSAVAGSIVAGFVLLPRLGLGLTTLIVTCVYGCVAILATFYAFRGARRWLGSAACLVMIAGWFLLGGWRIQLLALEQGQKVISFHDGADATVAVIQRADGHRVLKVNHDYILGSSAGADREVRQARLPLMLHPHPERVAFVGVATGMTVSAALDFPVQRVVGVELLPGVVDTLPLFAQWNRDVAYDPRVEIVVEDGRNFLAGTGEEFDVIISDLFVPWHAGTGDLYTVELFQTGRARLAPGGLFAQCLPGYQLSVEELRTIAASFLKVFPNAVLWRNDYDLDYPILCLTGFRDHLSLDPEAVRQHAQRIRSSSGTPAKFLADPAGLPLLFVCGPAELAQWSAGATLNTDNSPVIEFSTPKSLFQHKQKELQPVHDLLAKVRSHSWPFDQELAETPVQNLFQITDLVIDAQQAFSKNNFEREFQLVGQLAKLAGDSPWVTGYVMVVANRYQGRQMANRAAQLLEELVAFPNPPVPALVALAQNYRVAGQDQRAIELLEGALKRSPELLEPRKMLIDMLDHEAKYREAEPHLRELVRSQPEDPFLRIDLAKNLHRQKKIEEARTEVDKFLTEWDGTSRDTVWRYLRSSGLGPYVDSIALQGEPEHAESLPESASTKAPNAQEN